MVNEGRVSTATAGTTTLTSVQAAASEEAHDTLARLRTSASGLPATEAASRLAADGPNSLPAHRASARRVLWAQVKSPILLLLTVAAILSLLTGDAADATIMLVIIVVSVGIGFWNEYRAQITADSLQDKVSHTAFALRDGSLSEVPVAELVAGDIVRISLGQVVPADLRLLEVTGLSCDESSLTGESIAVDKATAPVTGTPGLGDLSCCAMMGTVVHSGSGLGVVVATGLDAAFGRIAGSLNTSPPETSFQRGLGKFSMFLMWVALALTVFIFAANAFQHRPILTALMFALAIAVGITPQLLPAVVNTSLAVGARQMAKQRVLVKRLICIEDLGNLDILVTDKTGTLTDGRISLTDVVPVNGATRDDVLRLGLLCCANDFTVEGTTGVGQDPLDSALAAGALDQVSLIGTKRLALRPFDHDSRTNAVLIDDQTGRHQIIKGAPEAVLALCSDAASNQQTLDALFDRGLRVVAVADRAADGETQLSATDNGGFRLVGYLCFLDQPKADAQASLDRLAALGITVKIATGDNASVAVKVCRDLGIDPGEPLVGDTLDSLTDDELYAATQQTAVLARVSPDQKARIIHVLRRQHAVGFLGDGVNDAPALHAADVGLSVDTAVDVAKDAADVVLLDKDLGVVADAVVNGRRVFCNTIKYVQMGTSSNFGNMFSAALASLLLPFLPMTPGQILLNNLLYDTSQLSIPSDSVDEEQLRKPSHWDIGQIRRFMMIFGPISSIFDFITFGVMLYVLHAGVPEFQAGWFVESLATQILIVFVIRTRRVPFWKSRPGRWLLTAVLGVLVIGAVIPYTGFGELMSFNPLPPLFFMALTGIVVVYLIFVELAKVAYYRWFAHPTVSLGANRHSAQPARLAHDIRRHQHTVRRASRFS